jgi:hypothetical protein
MMRASSILALVCVLVLGAFAGAGDHRKQAVVVVPSHKALNQKVLFVQAPSLHYSPVRLELPLKVIAPAPQTLIIEQRAPALIVTTQQNYGYSVNAPVSYPLNLSAVNAHGLYPAFTLPLSAVHCK